MWDSESQDNVLVVAGIGLMLVDGGMGYKLNATKSPSGFLPCFECYMQRKNILDSSLALSPHLHLRDCKLREEIHQQPKGRFLYKA